MFHKSTAYVCLLASLYSLASADDAAAPGEPLTTDPMTGVYHLGTPCPIQSLGSGVTGDSAEDKVRLRLEASWDTPCSIVHV